MIEKLKETIKDLAFSAVNYAENALSGVSGKEKKQLAIEFVISKLPIPSPFKSLIGLLLIKFIDNAIETALTYVKNMQFAQED